MKPELVSSTVNFPFSKQKHQILKVFFCEVELFIKHFRVHKQKPIYVHMRNCESIDLLAKKTPKKLFENTRKVHSVPSAKEVKGS